MDGEVNHTARAALLSRFAGRVTLGQCPGNVVAAFDSSGLLYGDGFGDRGDGQPPTLDTAFRIASVTKSFTAATVLVLIDRGLVSLAQPVAEILDLPRLIGPDGDPVRSPTLAELLSMSAGLPNDDPWADRQESMSSDDFATLLASGVRFAAPPGQRYEYSNLGYAMVGAVIEKLTGRGFVEVVTDELIDPLGLAGIGFDADLPGVDQVAIGYVKSNRVWHREPFTSPGAFSAIGGVVASARGLVEWLRWLGSPGDDRVLSHASRRLMFTPRTPINLQSDDPTHYGLGLVVQQQHRHGLIAAHSGGYPGFGAHVRWHVDSGVGVVAMENARYSAPVTPVTDALLSILDHGHPQPTVWPETRSARDQIEQLLRCWDDQLAAELCADNVELDQPLTQRRAELAALVAQVGELAEPLLWRDAEVNAPTPARLEWTVLAARGRLRCSIAMTPTEPPRVQTWTVSLG